MQKLISRNFFICWYSTPTSEYQSFTKITWDQYYWNIFKIFTPDTYRKSLKHFHINLLKGLLWNFLRIDFKIFCTIKIDKLTSSKTNYVFMEYFSKKNIPSDFLSFKIDEVKISSNEIYSSFTGPRKILIQFYKKSKVRVCPRSARVRVKS